MSPCEIFSFGFDYFFQSFNPILVHCNNVIFWISAKITKTGFETPLLLLCSLPFNSSLTKSKSQKPHNKIWTVWRIRDSCESQFLNFHRHLPWIVTHSTRHMQNQIFETFLWTLFSNFGSNFWKNNINHKVWIEIENRNASENEFRETFGAKKNKRSSKI
jgi:hypothetical protein